MAVVVVFLCPCDLSAENSELHRGCLRAEPFAYGVFSAANEGRNDYHPMFFTHDRAFEELFGICIQLLNKTWKEMRATAEDFNKVSAAVPRRGCWEKTTRQLDSWPAPRESVPELENQPGRQN